MLKKTAAAGLAAVFITLVLISLSFAEKGSGVLTGVTTAGSMVVNNNIQEAKQKAVSDALNIALQNAFAELVPGQVLAANLDFFYDQVLSHTQDYIITYRVLGGIETGNRYLVGVESKVDLALLEKTLTGARILNAGKDKPVVLFFIAEKTPSDLLPRYWWGKNPIPYRSVAEQIIIDQMIRDRFVVIGNGPKRPDPSFYNIRFDSIYDAAAAVKLGKAMKADMIVFGKAVASEAVNRMGEEKAFHAEITLDGYSLETGEKVVASQLQAVVKNDMEQEGNLQAVEKAARLSAADLSEKIDAYWTRNLRKERHFDVRLEGEHFLPRFVSLKQRLKQMPEIENMQPKENGSNHAVMEVFYKGSSSQFADAVMLKTFDSFGLEISDVAEDQVTIKFIGKGQAPLPDDSRDTENPGEDGRNIAE